MLFPECLSQQILGWALSGGGEGAAPGRGSPCSSEEAGRTQDWALSATTVPPQSDPSRCLRCVSELLLRSGAEIRDDSFLLSGHFKSLSFISTFPWSAMIPKFFYSLEKNLRILASSVGLATLFPQFGFFMSFKDMFMFL